MLDSNLRSIGVELKNSESTREENMHIAVVEKEKARKDDYVQLEMLERRIKLKCKELCQVKQAARIILQQRSDIESFFLDALAFVRKQVISEKVRRKVRERLPPITGNNTSMVERGSLSQNEQSYTIDVSELAWEQKEQVLTMLFAQMNGKKVFSKKQSSVSDDKSKKDNSQILEDLNTSEITSENASNTFITQNDIQDISIA